MTISGKPQDSLENQRAGLLTNILLIAAVCMLPLIRDPWAMDSGKVPRLLVLNIILAVCLMLTAFPAWRRCLDWSAVRHGVLFAFAAYTGTVWISLFHAGNVSAGLIDACRASATLILLAFSVACFRTFSDWRESLAKAGIVAAVCSGVVGEYQIASLSGLDFPSRRAMERVTGLMGNVNLFSGYLMLLLPFCILGTAILSRWWKMIGLAALIHTAFLLVLLQTRSAWFGGILCAAFFAIAVFINPNTFGIRTLFRRWIMSGGVVFVLATSVFLYFAPADNAFAFRVRSIFSDELGVADGGRMMIWGETLSIALRHLPFGIGAGNFPLKLHAAPGGGVVDFSKIDREWNQPHNDFLWIFAEKGIFGLLAFLLIFCWAFMAGLRVIRNARNPSMAWTACAAMAGLSAYLMDSFFSFPLERVNHQVLLALLLAMLVAEDQSQDGKKLQITGKNSFVNLVLSLISALLLVAGLVVSFASLRQEWLVAQAREAMNRMDWPTMQARAHAATTPLRTLDNYSVPVSFLEGFAWMKIGYDDEAIACLRQARRENPDKFYILNNLGILLNDRGDYDDAMALFIQAINLYPERTEALHNLAVSLFDQKRYEEAADVLLELPEERRDGNISKTLANAIRERNKSRLMIPASVEDNDEPSTPWDADSGIFSW